MGNVETEIGLDHWPNIYCGVAVLLLLPLYLAAKRISGKEKVVYSFLLLFFFASFYLAWVSFSQQPSMPSVLYLYFLGSGDVL